MTRSSFSRRQLVLGLGAAACLAPAVGRAQDYPNRPIRIVVGVPPGGSIDFGARVISEPLSQILGTPVIVENRSGAAGVIATDYVARQPGDGYTILLGTPSPIIIAPQLMAKSTLNPLTDLAAINMVSTSPIAFAVNPKLNVRRLKDLVALSRTRQISMGLPTAGSVSHLVVEMVAKATGCNFLEVPYKGAAPAITDTVGGAVDATVSDVNAFLGMHKEGRLRVIMVTSDKRIEQLPDVPTASEDSPGLVVTNWIGVFAPASTPKPIVAKLSAALVKVTQRPDVKSRFASQAVTASAMAGPEPFQKFVASEYLRYGRLARERGIVISE